MITQEELKCLVKYDPETGLFYWLVRDSNRKTKGWFAGGKTKLGYLRFYVKNKGYMAHRIAWLYVTGEWPTKEIDHINRVRDDNRWVNLREVNKNVNMQNQAQPHKNNKSGYLGVQVRHYSDRFYSEIKVNKTRIFLGSFSTALEAHHAYLKAKEIYHS